MSGQYIDTFDDQPPPDSQEPATAARPFIGIFFECCGVYARVYRAPDAGEYRGTCPKCLATVRAQVGPGGVSQRIFRAK